jgi:hypothetical protein
MVTTRENRNGRLTRWNGTPDRAEKALSLLERLEEIDNVAKILRLLVS